MGILISSGIVFGITLVLTKSKIMAWKREFVEKRYQASKVNGQTPNFIHTWWKALWTCPMCSGFWFAIPACWAYPFINLFVDVLIVFSINWIIHCIENVLFYAGEILKNNSKD